MVRGVAVWATDGVCRSEGFRALITDASAVRGHRPYCHQPLLSLAHLTFFVKSSFIKRDTTSWCHVSCPIGTYVVGVYQCVASPRTLRTGTHTPDPHQIRPSRSLRHILGSCILPRKSGLLLVSLNYTKNLSTMSLTSCALSASISLALKSTAPSKPFT